MTILSRNAFFYLFKQLGPLFVVPMLFLIAFIVTLVAYKKTDKTNIALRERRKIPLIILGVTGGILWFLVLCWSALVSLFILYM